MQVVARPGRLGPIQCLVDAVLEWLQKDILFKPLAALLCHLDNLSALKTLFALGDSEEDKAKTDTWFSIASALIDVGK